MGERPEPDECIFVLVLELDPQQSENEDEDDKTIKKPSSRQMENEGIQRFPSAHAERAGLILLLTEKLAGSVDGLWLIVDSQMTWCFWLSTINFQLSTSQPDERNQIGILTPGLNLAPAFPIKW